jgi:hypothetical protein
MTIDKWPGEDEGFNPSDWPTSMTLGGLGGFPLALCPQRKRRGRPKLTNEFNSIDGYRAWAMQGVVKILRAAGKPVPSQRALVEIMRHLERNLPKQEQAFAKSVKDSSLEESISRGKSLLKIEADWSGGLIDHDMPIR